MRKTLYPNVSLNSFAFANDIEPATLSRIENLKQDVKYTTLEKISSGFRMQTSELILKYEQWKEEN